MPAYSRASSVGATRRVVRVGVLFAALTLGLSLAASAANAEPITGPEPSSFLPELTSPRHVASTVPGNGDQKPYGVAVVPRTSGRLPHIPAVVRVEHIRPGSGVASPLTAQKLPGRSSPHCWAPRTKSLVQRVDLRLAIISSFLDAPALG